MAAPETVEDRFKKESIQPKRAVGCFLSVILYPARCAGNVVFMGTFPESAAPPRAAFFFVRMYSSFTGGFVFRHPGRLPPTLAGSPPGGNQRIPQFPSRNRGLPPPRRLFSLSVYIAARPAAGSPLCGCPAGRRGAFVSRQSNSRRSNSL